MTSVPTPAHRFGYIGLHSRVNYLWVEELGVEADSAALSSGTTGIKRRAIPDPPLLIYPNPVSGQDFHVQARNMESPLSLQIFNLNGQVVHAIENSMDTSFDISTSSLQGPGVYLVKLYGASGQTCRKLVICR